MNTSATEAQVEGIPLTEPRGTFGGNEDDDNSGVFRYVSIRNGGTVNSRYLVAVYCGDDAFDFDLGFRGKGQFWVALQEPGKGDHLIEGNGGIDPVSGLPYSLPVILHATLVGCGPDVGRNVIRFDRNAGGILDNSILVNQSRGIEVEYIPDSDNSYMQFESGNLQFNNNVFNQVAGNVPDQIFSVSAFQGVDVSQQEAALDAYFTISQNSIQDPGVYVSGGNFYLFPSGNVFDNLAPLPDEWFEATTFKGAFYTYNWLSGWTLIDESGMIQ